MLGRYVAALSLAAGTALVLSGCQKPPPAVTVWSGTTSVDQRALCWAFESDSLTPGQCADEILSGTSTAGTAELKAQAGNVVGISVDTAVAESGWTLRIGGQAVNREPLTGTYFRFTYPLGIPPSGIPMQIVAGRNGKTRGIWTVKVLPADA